MEQILQKDQCASVTLYSFLRLAQGLLGKCGFIRIAVVLLLVFALSNTAFAAHFKGGQITYKYLGDGKYDIIIIGYWEKHAVGSINPFYEGKPEMHRPPATVSKTLLPDGKTVEHVQVQQVRWVNPGIYGISWKSCCRSVGSNFNNNPNGLFTVVNYDPAVPSSSPQSYDLPIFNYGPDQSINYTLNMEDPEGHEQEYSLEIPYGLTADAYKDMQASGFELTSNGAVLWANTLPGLWLVNVKLREKINGNYTGAYITREFLIKVSAPGENAPPVFKNVFAKTVKEGQALTFEIEASDAADQQVTLVSSGSVYGKGAGFVQTTKGSLAKGVFTWTPELGAAGTYKVQFVATDDHASPLSSQINVIITVEVCKPFATDYSIVSKPCVGSNNGKVALSTSAEEGVTYSYSLDNGVTYQSSSVFENLAPGTYTGIIKDDAGCVSEPVVIGLEEAPLPIVSLDMPISSFCANSAAVTLTGGSPSAGYYHGTGVENGVFYPSVAGVGAHIISYTFTDSNGCSNTASVEVAVVEALIADAGPAKEVFKGYPELTCATLVATATGGKAPYAYKWSTGETTSSIKVCPTATTTYRVEVTDALGCVSVSEVVVTVYNVECGSNSDKVLLCHKGKTICVDPETAKEHLGHGDTLGECGVSGESTTGPQSNSVSAVNSKKNVTAESVATPSIVVFPNPLTDASQVKILLDEATSITVDIIDISGNVVRTLYKGNAEANKELTVAVGGDLKGNSMYIGRVITSKGVQHFKLMKL